MVLKCFPAQTLPINFGPSNSQVLRIGGSQMFHRPNAPDHFGPSNSQTLPINFGPSNSQVLRIGGSQVLPRPDAPDQFRALKQPDAPDQFRALKQPDAPDQFRALKQPGFENRWFSDVSPPKRSRYISGPQTARFSDFSVVLRCCTAQTLPIYFGPSNSQVLRIFGSQIFHRPDAPDQFRALRF